jgi:hypothetical protein
VSRLDRQVDRFAAALERAGFALMAAGMLALGLVLLGYLAGWWLLAVALVAAVLVARSFLRARAVINAPLTRVDPRRTTVIRARVTRRVHTDPEERNVRKPGGVVDENGQEVQ